MTRVTLSLISNRSPNENSSPKYLRAAGVDGIFLKNQVQCHQAPAVPLPLKCHEWLATPISVCAREAATFAVNAPWWQSLAVLRVKNLFGGEESENLVCCATARTKTELSILQFWFNDIMVFFFQRTYTFPGG